MARGAEYTHRAEQDLDEILSFLLEQSTGVALKFAEAVDATTEMLVRFPELGRDFGHRRRVIAVRGSEYLLMYELVDDGVRVLAIGHGRRGPGWLHDRL